jgi:hypothetical protein
VSYRCLEQTWLGVLFVYSTALMRMLFTHLILQYFAAELLPHDSSHQLLSMRG